MKSDVMCVAAQTANSPPILSSKDCQDRVGKTRGTASARVPCLCFRLVCSWMRQPEICREREQAEEIAKECPERPPSFVLGLRKIKFETEKL